MSWDIEGHVIVVRRDGVTVLKLSISEILCYLKARRNLK